MKTSLKYKNKCGGEVLNKKIELFSHNIQTNTFNNMKRILFLLFLIVLTIPSIAIPKTNKHCVMVAIDDYMYENADDPKSIEYVSKGNLIEHDSGMFSQKVKFRAKNKYGTYAITEWCFTVTHHNGNAKVVSIDNVSDVQKLVRSGELIIINWYNPCDGSRIYNKDLQKM